MNQRLAILAATSGLLLAGCGSSSHATSGSHRPSYPANVQTNFLNACETNSSLPKCDCLLKYIQAHVPLNAFTTSENALEAGNKNYPGWVYDAQSSCQNVS